MGVTEILCTFRLVLKGKTGKEIPEPSRFEFLEKLSTNNFALSEAEDNTFASLNRGGMADLSLLRTLLAIHQVTKVTFLGSDRLLIVLLAHASLAASRTLLQRLPACMNFTLESEDLAFKYKRKKLIL